MSITTSLSFLSFWDIRPSWLRCRNKVPVVGVHGNITHARGAPLWASFWGVKSIGCKDRFKLWYLAPDHSQWDAMFFMPGNGDEWSKDTLLEQTRGRMLPWHWGESSQCNKGKKMGDVAAEKESMDQPGHHIAYWVWGLGKCTSPCHKTVSLPHLDPPYI